MNLNCWKSFNITKEFGSNRIYLLSLILGTFSFILLYLPVSMLHQHQAVKDYGLFPIAVALFLLPTIHKLMHMIPLLLLNKRVRIRWKLKRGILPTFTYRTFSTLSKKTSILMALAPTLFLTIPGIVTSYVFPNYYAYILVFTAVNIGMSFTDFLCVRQFLLAPKKCIIENAKDGYDILIDRYKQ
ncbi:DUF3267 domain-containing protein [Pontibacillus yanchengensis]|uniref:Zincin peptidase n=1 Tax=Pontibacillus yanchengensis Y32 TaxID=1385514 RepID=A0A0A2TSP5_9BACI|nr:DUF3267 domain-containing protein [Pontibacillus yanchengensis]KGP72260.1 hypothetical protein N782_13475 [Pontibacillus yanchengensis Y32]